MKKFYRSTALAVSLFILAGLFAFPGAAYGASDKKLIVTHIDTKGSTEGSAIVLTPNTGPDVGSSGSSFAWWILAVFDWDEADYCYKVTELKLDASQSADKSEVKIPANGFVYAICIGNDYSASNGINYITQRIVDSYNFIKALKVGQKAYLYNINLLYSITGDNGKLWYAADYESYSFIKIDAKEDGMTEYDPHDSDVPVSEYTFPVTHINVSGTNGMTALLFTRAFGKDIRAGSSPIDYAWWTGATFEWDGARDCYVITVVSLNYGTGYAKQLLIPENGFVLLFLAEDSANGAFAKSKELEVGFTANLYGADLSAGTLSGAELYVNHEKSGAAAYQPEIINKLETVELKDGYKNKFSVKDSENFTVEWEPVAGAEKYFIYISNNSGAAEGRTEVPLTEITGTSYTVNKNILSIGDSYTFGVYASASGRSSGMIARTEFYAVSENAFNSSLRGKTVVVFGDSLTARMPGWVGGITGNFDVDMINAGVGGDSTYQGRLRFAKDVLSKNPDLVIINFGMNDQAVSGGKPLVALETYTANLEFFASELLAAGSDVLFVTPNRVNTNPGYHNPGSGLNYGTDSLGKFCGAMRAVAAKYGCGLVDINAECEYENMDTFVNAGGDGLHQSAYGYQRYTELISDYLEAFYDNKDKASVTVEIKAGSGAVVGGYTLNGRVGANVSLPVPEIGNYVYSSGAEDIYKFSAIGETVVLNYQKAGFELKSDSGFSIINDCLYINAERLKAADVLAGFETGGLTVEAYKGDYIGTGSKVQIVSNGTVTAFITVILKGDVNGDGTVNALDNLLVKKYVLKSAELNGPFLSAAKTGSPDSDVTAKDYMLVKKHVLKSYNLYK